VVSGLVSGVLSCSTMAIVAERHYPEDSASALNSSGNLILRSQLK